MKRRKCFRAVDVAAVLLAFAAVLGGCGGGRARQAVSRREALEKLLAALRQVSAMARQPEGEPAMYAPTVARYLDDPQLNDVPDIQSLRDQWRALHRDLMDHPSAAGLTDRLDDLERRVGRLLSSEEGTGS